MKLLCISDLHGGVRDLRLDDVDALVVCGDITHFEGRGAAAQILDKFKDAKVLLGVPGNCDNMDVNEALVERNADLHARGRVIGGIGFFGAGGSNATPFNTPQEYQEEELWNFLSKGYEQVKGAQAMVLVSHTPPSGTGLDRARGTHVGSEKIREFIEERRPRLVLCGHVHESKGTDTIGDTVIVNPGMLKNGHALVDIGPDIKVEFFDV